ncbi:MAG: UDP-N-acetylmuramoyl-L-alanine--D-glutamate ligase [Bacteroidales bacterium]|nr:UDP-N-acetylmuramoyl-L-alanine--D-glutamate ligase [Bacteroidales bacterium]
MNDNNNLSPARRLVVLGAGESGVGAAILGKDKGFDVFVSDMGHIADKYRKVLEEENIPFEDGRHSEELILNADTIVKSPGIPLTAPMIVKAIEKGIEVISEIEFAGRFTDAKMVCITGSNGKTTTTMLTYHIFREAGIDAGLAGNVGNSLALQVARHPHPVYVIELSSFQLDNMYDFRADIAIILNITPDHLDRYDYKMENYARAKMRITRNQRPDDVCIYWNDDELITSLLKENPTDARLLPFSATDNENMAAHLHNETVIFTTAGNNWEVKRADISIRGLHNLYNTMAAGLAATVAGISPESIRHSLATFKSVEHRLEHVRDWNGIRFINDSKATNVNSTYYALESMDRPTILILGGKDKGNDYTEIEEFVSKKVKGIVCMGVDNRKLLEFFSGKVARIADTHSLEDAVKASVEMAEEGDTVLLSPCCASFDLFSSYEDRGRQFKDAVGRL